MSDDIKADVIKTTQDTLGKFIKKPTLTEKLLKKPPFRFLHDIVTGTIRETGFLSGLYTDAEMQSDNIKDREMKIAFLQKLIDCVKLVTDKNINARPSKIVAGLEPTKTNELLQAIGFALKKKLDSSEAIAQLNNTEPREPSKVKTKTKDSSNKKVTKTKEVKEKTDKLKQSPTTNTNSNNATPRGRKSDPKLNINKKEEKPKIKESPRAKIVKKPEAPKKPKLSPKEKNDKQKKEEPEPEPILEQSEPEPIIKAPEPEPEIISTPQELQIQIPDIVPSPTKADQVEEIRIKTPKRSKSRREQPITPGPGPEPSPPEMLSKEPSKIDIPRPKTSLRPPSVRPSSARPGAPRLKDRNEIILPQDEVVPMGKVNVIVENFGTQDEDEEDNEETVVVETLPEIVFEQKPLSQQQDIDIPAEKGHLVAQILEQIDSSIEGHDTKTKPSVEIEWEGGGKRNREAASKEMEKLRDSIQTLTRAANPLGKLMNFLQEDIDSMRSELKMWIDVNEKLVGEIRTQEKLNDESIEPLKKQLIRLDDDIQKQNEQISVTQANILKNEQKIKMLLTRDP